MQKSFKDMTTEERAKVKADMLKIPVSGDEVLKFDPMIHKLIKQEILKYWGNGVSVYSGDVMIGRLGMSFNDLMQYGRLLVCNQIRWFKMRGMNPETGKPWVSKMTTLIHQQLRNKYMSLSKSAASEKNGGQVVNVTENKEILQKYYDALDETLDVETNIKMLDVALINCTKELQKKLHRNHKTNKDLKAHVYHVLNNMDSVSYVSYEDIEGFSAASTDLDPERALLFKEAMADRVKNSGGKQPFDFADAIKKKKHTVPKFFPKDVSPLLMVLARKEGISSQKELADQLGVGMTTLSNIIRGRSKGTSEFRSRVEQRFGKTFDELLTVVHV